MDMATRVQIPDKAVCIFTLHKYPSERYEFNHRLIVGQTKSLTLYGKWSQKKNSKFKPAILCFKIDLVSHLACGGGVG